MHQVPSLFKTITTGEEYGIVFGELPPPPVIPIPYFLFHFSKQRDICRDVHWGVDFPKGEGYYDHAHP